MMVFRAHESDEAELYRLFCGAGYTYWQMIERHIDEPWFHVMVKRVECDWGESAIADEGDWDEELDCDEDDASREQKGFTQFVLMPNNPSMLEHVLEDDSEDFIIEDVQVVLPPRMTGMDHWTMEPLVELSAEVSPEGNIINIYTVGGGNIYRFLNGWVLKSNPLSQIEPRLIYRRP